MKIGGYSFFERVSTNQVIKKENTTWGKLWSTVQEWKLFQGKVTQPYSQVANAYKAVKAICDNSAQASIGFYKWDNDEEIYPAELIKLFTKPNSRQSGQSFIRDIVGYFALYGESFIVKQLALGNLTGQRRLPSALETFSPSKFEKVSGKDEYNNEVLTGWKLNNKGLPLEQVIHIKDFNPYDTLRGLSPLKPLANEIDLDYLTMIYNKAFFNNDATPSFVMSTDKSLTEEQRERIMQWFEKRHIGAGNKGKIDIFEGGLRPEVISASHRDMDFMEQKKYMREEILGTYRTPKALFNITETLNYATFMGQMKVFWLYAIMPILSMLENEINSKLIVDYDPSIYFKFNLKNVPAFQEDFNAKVVTAQILFNMGFTADEINTKLELGFDEQEWRKHYWISPLLTPADILLEQELNPTPETPAPETTPPDNTGSAKQLGVNKDIRLLTVWKSFLGRQVALERVFESKIKRFFYEQRKRFLVAFTEQNSTQGDRVLNWEHESAELIKLVKPIIFKCIDEGVKQGESLLGSKKGIADDILKHKLEAYLEMRCDLIKGINNTTQAKIKKTLEQGVQAGETYSQLAERLKDVFNLMGSRAKLIARTETAGGINGGSEIYYKENGVEGKQWLTAGDEAVRESHRAIDGDIVDINSRFANGLRYPSDQDGEPAEVCNCRCTLIPIIK